MNSIPITDIVKGDTFSLEGDLDTAITGWKLRCEIYDECGQCIKLATANSGGSNDQIEITNASDGLFTIKVAKDLTACFADKSFIEIEGETSSGEIYTILPKGEILFLNQKIDWTTP